MAIEFKVEAQVKLQLKSERVAEVILQALMPEVKNQPTQRVTISLKREHSCLFLTFKADSTSALRAAVNSYLRWILSLSEVLSLIEATTNKSG